MAQRRTFRRARRVSGTLNNPTVAEKAVFEALVTDDGHDPRVKYLVFQSEVGATGVIHIQFYCMFHAQLGLRPIHDILGARVHVDASRGTPGQNKHYCLKPHDGCECHHCEDARALPNVGREVAPGFITGEYGRMRAARSGSMTAVIDMMDTGATLNEILLANPEQAIKFGTRITQEFGRRLPERDWAMEIEIFVGETGTGKSFTAKLENPESISIPWPTGGRWWMPGYTGQHTIVLDEFRMQIKMDTMLKVMDRYAWTTESKGSNFPFVSRKIVITTNIDPKDWYQMVKLVASRGQQARKVVLAPLARRICEYATIYDFAAGTTFPNFVKVARPKPTADWFKFNESVVHDFRGGGNDGRADQFDIGQYGD